MAVCQSGYIDWTGVCTQETYTPNFDACPTSCGNAASTITPTSCTRSPDGITVAASYCSSSTSNCPATASCTSYSWGAWGGCSGGTQARSCNGSDGSVNNNPALCGGPASQSCTTPCGAWTQMLYSTNIYCDECQTPFTPIGAANDYYLQLSAPTNCVDTVYGTGNYSAGHGATVDNTDGSFDPNSNMSFPGSVGTTGIIGPPIWSTFQRY